MARDSDRDRDRSSRRSRDEPEHHHRHGRRHRDEGRESEERRRPPRDDGRCGEVEEEEEERVRSRSMSREASVEASRKRKGHREDREPAGEKRPRVSDERWRGDEGYGMEEDKEEEEERRRRREDDADVRKDREERRPKDERRERREGSVDERREKEDRRTRDERRERRREEDGYERKEKERRLKEERREKRRKDDEGYERKEKEERRLRSERGLSEERWERRSKEERAVAEERRERREDDGKKRKEEERRMKQERAVVEERRERREDDGKKRKEEEKRMKEERAVVEERRERREDDGKKRKEEERRMKEERAVVEERRERREDDGKKRKEEERRMKDEWVRERGGDEKQERWREGSVEERREEGRMKDGRASRDERRERRREEDGDEGKGKEERELMKGQVLVDKRREKRRGDEGFDLDGRKEEGRRRRGFREEVKEVVKEELMIVENGRRELRMAEKVKEEEREEEIKGKVKDEVYRDDNELKNGGMLRKVKEERMDVDGGDADGNGGDPGAKGFAPGPVIKESELVQNTSAAYHKVSSVTNNIENGLLNRADEVHGKSSTEGPTTSVTGKSGNLLLSALDKAKKALQKQKELAEKLKKIPELDKLSTSGVDGSLQVGTSKGTQNVPSSLPSATIAVPSQDFSGPSTVAWVASASSSDSTTAAGIHNLSGVAIEAVKRAQEVAARMGFRQDPQFAPLINMFPGTVPEVAVPQKPSKAPVLRLDAQGREIDEHGNVINMPKPTNLSTLKVNINKQKKEAFQILKPDLDANLESNPYFDSRMGINKTKLLRPKRMSFQFVEEGKWSRQAEIIRFKNQFGEAQAKELKTKQAQLAKAKAEPDINPNLIELSERVVVKEKQKVQIPDMEWWDVPLLPSGKYDDIADDKLNMEKITIYVEHPLPIQPPAEPAPPPPQPLKLTKKETKKLRTQRRLAKERDRQEMIRQGLIEPPKPKIKMSNLMKVLGAEATQDPTKLEMEIRSAAAEREQAHVDRNIARKLTPSERREKQERKLFDDPNSSLETIVTVYKVNSLAHPKARFQVDVNAQENRLTGCAVISDGMCVVVVEGGKKSNKRYKNLMLRRIDWAAAVENEDDGDDNSDVPVNKCLLVWQGSIAKPNFNRFLIHQCRTEAAARKVFADAGVPHYWDLAANFSGEI